jgi:putative transposase
MPIGKTKLNNAAIAAKSLAVSSIPKELVDQFMKGPMTGETVNFVPMAFKKALIKRALGAELGHHMGHSKGPDKPEAATNQRNGERARP